MQLELIEIGSRAREFLALEVSESQRGLVATMAQRNNSKWSARGLPDVR